MHIFAALVPPTGSQFSKYSVDHAFSKALLYWHCNHCTPLPDTPFQCKLPAWESHFVSSNSTSRGMRLCSSSSSHTTESYILLNFRCKTWLQCLTNDVPFFYYSHHWGPTHALFGMTWSEITSLTLGTLSFVSASAWAMRLQLCRSSEISVFESWWWGNCLDLGWIVRASSFQIQYTLTQQTGSITWKFSLLQQIMKIFKICMHPAILFPNRLLPYNAFIFGKLSLQQLTLYCHLSVEVSISLTWPFVVS